MFARKTVRIFSLIAIILCSIGLLLSALIILISKSSYNTFAFAMGIVSWAILLWASVIGYKLCTTYNLYDDEYKKVGIRIYLIILAFILFFFIGLIAGIVISVILLSTLWGLKKNYDEWEYNNPPAIDEPVKDDANLQS